MLEMVNGAALGFAMFTVWTMLLVPKPWEPKARDVGKTAVKGSFRNIERLLLPGCTTARSSPPSLLKSPETGTGSLKFKSTGSSNCCAG